MKKLLLLSVLFSSSGWCDELPDCSSKEVTDGILSNMNSQVGKIEGKTVFESITDSRPQHIDREVNKVVCASVLNAWIYPYPGTTMLPFTLVTLPFRFTVQGANGKLYYETFPQEFTADTRAAQEQARYEYKLKYDQEQAQKKAQEQQKTKIQQPTTTQSTSINKTLKVPSCSDDNALSSLRETFVDDFQDSQLKDAFYEMNLFNITEFKLINSHPDANECQGEVEWIVNPDTRPAYIPIYYTFYADGRITYYRDQFWSEIKKAESNGNSKNPTVFPKNVQPSTYAYSQSNTNQPVVQKQIEIDPNQILSKSVKIKDLDGKNKTGIGDIVLINQPYSLHVKNQSCDIVGNIVDTNAKNGEFLMRLGGSEGNTFILHNKDCQVEVFLSNEDINTVKLKGCQSYCATNSDPSVLNGKYK
ncbi:hypothetical protein R7J84_003099 [Escherichia coli]|nr:hypothetical protein [Escherichia coli]